MDSDAPIAVSEVSGSIHFQAVSSLTVDIKPATKMSHTWRELATNTWRELLFESPAGRRGRSSVGGLAALQSPFSRRTDGSAVTVQSAD